MSKEPEASIMKILVTLYESGAHYIGLVVFAVLGGLMNYLDKLRKGEHKFKLLPFIVDLAISGFAGLLVALLAISAELKPELVYALTGIAGHLGARGIFLLQLWITKKLKIDKEFKQ